ncbi:hypothetical protein CFU_4217 [Collimonas fungivorans Ter331]|uniref:Uncharacterized protein n=1 Tax=Collimonas fungivorans (strain Ter331) TaxID=1005048 RepID=G0AEA8_COLFT|nr:hypothetical protein CFU_4217 [Collimonas fungivorans Ter331]
MFGRHGADQLHAKVVAQEFQDIAGPSFIHLGKRFVVDQQVQAVALFEALEAVGDDRGVNDIGRRLQLAAGTGAPFRQADMRPGIRFLVDFVAAVVAVVGDPLQFLDRLVFVVGQQQLHQAIAHLAVVRAQDRVGKQVAGFLRIRHLGSGAEKIVVCLEFRHPFRPVDAELVGAELEFVEFGIERLQGAYAGIDGVTDFIAELLGEYIVERGFGGAQLLQVLDQADIFLPCQLGAGAFLQGHHQRIQGREIAVAQIVALSHFKALVDTRMGVVFAQRIAGIAVQLPAERRLFGDIAGCLRLRIAALIRPSGDLVRQRGERQAAVDDTQVAQSFSIAVDPCLFRPHAEMQARQRSLMALYGFFVAADILAASSLARFQGGDFDAQGFGFIFQLADLGQVEPAQVLAGGVELAHQGLQFVDRGKRRALQLPHQRQRPLQLAQLAAHLGQFAFRLRMLLLGALLGQTLGFLAEHQQVGVGGEHGARAAALAIPGQTARGMAQGLGIGDLDHLAELVVQVGMRNRVLGAEFVHDRIARGSFYLQVLQAEAALDHIGAQFFLPHEIDGFAFPSLVDHQVETGASQVTFDCRLPFSRDRFYQVAQHLGARGSQLGTEFFQRMADMLWIIGAAFGQVRFARSGVFFVAQGVMLGRTQLCNLGMQGRNETVFGAGQRAVQFAEGGVDALKAVDQHQRFQHIHFFRLGQFAYAAQMGSQVQRAGGRQRQHYLAGGIGNFFLLRRNLHAGHIARRAFQLLGSQRIVLQRAEHGLDLAVVLFDLVLDPGFLLGGRNAHHLRVDLCQAAVLGAAVLLQLVGALGFVADQRLQSFDGRAGGFQLALVFAQGQRRHQQLRLAGGLVRARGIADGFAEQLQALDVVAQALAFLAQFVDLAHQLANLADALRQLAGVEFQDLVLDQVVDAADRLVGDRLAPGPGRAFGFGERDGFLAAETAVQLAQILALAVAEIGDAAVFPGQVVLDLFHRHHRHAAIDLGRGQVAQLQGDAIDDQQGQPFRHRLAALAGAVDTGGSCDQRGELAPFFALAWLEYRGDVAVRAVGTGEQVVLSADDVRPQGAFGLAVARALGSLVLARVVAENILVHRRHHGLQGVQHGRFAGAGGTGQQRHVAHRVFLRPQGAPVHQDQFIQLHSRFPSMPCAVNSSSAAACRLACPVSPSAPAGSGSDSSAASSMSSLMMPRMVGRIASKASSSSMEKFAASRIRRWRLRSLRRRCRSILVGGSARFSCVCSVADNSSKRVSTSPESVRRLPPSDKPCWYWKRSASAAATKSGDNRARNPGTGSSPSSGKPGTSAPGAYRRKNSPFRLCSRRKPPSWK